jgi:hypothetical protein
MMIVMYIISMTQKINSLKNATLANAENSGCVAKFR